MSYRIATTRQYEKDIKLAKKRGLPLKKLAEIILLLEKGEPLPAKNRDHILTGDYVGYRECHITPDWLLIYEKAEEIKLVTLTRTGTHSDLFK